VSNQADIRDIQALSSLKAAFGRFGVEVLQLLPSIQKQFEEIQDRLQEREAHWERQVEAAREEVNAARRALSSCHKSGYYDREGDYVEPDCSWEENQVGYAEGHLAECESNLEIVKQWRHRIESQIADFQNDIHRLSNLASTRTGSAQTFLTTKSELLDRYVDSVSPVIGTVDLLAQSRNATMPSESRISSAEKQALYKYSDMEYLSINKQLREGVSDQVTSRRIELISQALRKLPEYKGLVYRRDSFEAHMVKYVPGNIVEEPAFTSTSLSANATFSGNVLFTIKSKTGRDISQHARYPEEEEILFDRGTKFRVLNRKDINDSNGVRIEIEIEEV
jgi:hypothetical protein